MERRVRVMASWRVRLRVEFRRCGAGKNHASSEVAALQDEQAPSGQEDRGGPVTDLLGGQVDAVGF